MSKDSKLKKLQESAVYTLLIAAEMLEKEKHELLNRYLSSSTLEMQSGMSAEEIEAVKEQAEHDCKTLMNGQ